MKPKKDPDAVGRGMGQASSSSFQSAKLNKTRASTAKSTMSFSSARQSQSQFYIAEKQAGRVVDDDTLSVADHSIVEKTLL